MYIYFFLSTKQFMMTGSIAVAIFLVTLVGLLLESYYFGSINLGNSLPFCSYHDLIH